MGELTTVGLILYFGLIIYCIVLTIQNRIAKAESKEKEEMIRRMLERLAGLDK